MEFLTHFEPIGDQTFGGAMSVKSVESVKSVVVKKGYGYKIRARKRNGLVQLLQSLNLCMGGNWKKALAQLQENPFQEYDRARKRHCQSPKRDYWKRHFVFL